MSTTALDCGDQHLLGFNNAEKNSSSEPSKGMETSDPAPELGPEMGESDPEVEANNGGVRAEIDTSAPFESVKEAASRFGGMGFWRPTSLRPSLLSQLDITRVEEQAVLLEKDLIVKERETLNVLKELEATKTMVEELKLKLQTASLELNAALNANSSDNKNVNPPDETSKKGSNEDINGTETSKSAGGLHLCPSSAPGLILMELKQAKLKLNRTTNDLSDIRATVESYNKKIENERVSLEKTRRRLSSNSLKISALEEDLNQTNLKLQVVKDAESKDGCDNPMDIAQELQRLGSETEQFKKMGEAAKSKVLRAMAEIEHTKAKIKTAEISLVAARKMKEAAKASEAVALAEIKALSNSENSSRILQQQPEVVTLSFEEYSTLTAKAREVDEASKKRVRDAMVEVEEANTSQTEILKRVEEATEEVKVSKKALEEALNRVEAANRGKMAVEEALRKWRSDRCCQRRRYVQNSTKFKNSYSSHHRKDSRLLDVNGLNLINTDSKPILRPTLSIGQILSRKLLLSEDYENRIQVEKNIAKHKVSLGQMLGKQNSDILYSQKGERESGHKQLPTKRKKFGFGRISLLVKKRSKKKQNISSRWRST